MHTGEIKQRRELYPNAFIIKGKGWEFLFGILFFFKQKFHDKKNIHFSSAFLTTMYKMNIFNQNIFLKPLFIKMVGVYIESFLLLVKKNTTCQFLITPRFILHEKNNNNKII